jgi:hypothetical protein
MKLYQINVPLDDNDGRPYDHTAWRAQLLRTFGGYTMSGACGAWRNGGGRDFYDSLTVYHIATDDQAALETMILQFPRYFEGQEACFWACIGEAWIS